MIQDIKPEDVKAGDHCRILLPMLKGRGFVHAWATIKNRHGRYVTLEIRTRQRDSIGAVSDITKAWRYTETLCTKKQPS